VPLPLPNLDTRRWGELVEEGRALVPRHAPGWTDHNMHDPGITLLELIAWLVEQDIYRANRVPERHVRKFLRLAGFEPEPARAARVALSFALASGQPPFTLARGTVVGGAVGAGRAVPFRTTARLRVGAARLAVVQTWDGRAYEEVTRLWREGLAFGALGDAPGFDGAERPALLLGLDSPPEPGERLSLWLSFDGGADAVAERLRIAGEEPCRPRPALGLEWELYDGSSWRGLRARDETFGLTLDGIVSLRVGGFVAGAARIGAVPEPLCWLRCRAADGVPDVTPRLLDLAVNAVVAEQRRPARDHLAIAPGVAQPPTPLQVGRWARLRLELDDREQIDSIERTTDRAAKKALVLELGADALGATFVLAGVGTGLPEQRLSLLAAPVADGAVALWSVEPVGVQRWEQRADFDAAAHSDRSYVLDGGGVLRFGDGERGRVPALGVPLFAVYDETAGAAGNLGAASSWELAGVDDAVNRALSGKDPAVLAAQLAPVAPITAHGAATGGADEEDVAHASGRAAEALWAHERLLELAPGTGGTLDGLDPAVVRARLAPPRAATTLDFERLAIEVPGRRVLRARAWAGLDAGAPGLLAPGTVTVVVVNGSPADRPQPSPSLLAAVDAYLRRRKTLGTRLVVSGPTYIEVTVTARVKLAAGAAPSAVRRRVLDTLNGFLHPLVGGPSGRGWPFGRDVYRPDLLGLVDRVPGVDSVEELTLAGGDEGVGCGNVCVGPAELVVSGPHSVETVT
jgi:predicted phage baseplate assembly protein